MDSEWAPNYDKNWGAIDPTHEQVKTWLQQTSFRLVDETVGEDYRHFLVQKVYRIGLTHLSVSTHIWLPSVSSSIHPFRSVRKAVYPSKLTSVSGEGRRRRDPGVTLTSTT